jgi:hypothetical protein
MATTTHVSLTLFGNSRVDFIQGKCFETHGMDWNGIDRYGSALTYAEIQYVAVEFPCYASLQGPTALVRGSYCTHARGPVGLDDPANVMRSVTTVEKDDRIQMQMRMQRSMPKSVYASYVPKKQHVD